MAIAKKHKIVVDENDFDCIKGKEMASSITSVLERRTKNLHEIVSLQGKNLWCKWAKKEKEKYRHKESENEKEHLSLNEYSARLGREMSKIRDEQFKLINSSSNQLMNIFVATLVSEKGIIRNYFLRWIKIFLDNLSRRELPPLHRQYKEKKEKLFELQERKCDEKTIQNCKDEIMSLNMKLIHASFGLEHLLREVGQIYEATRHTRLASKYKELPKVVAELLIDGYPLELMDGDAAHVPLIWVSAVLEELRKCLKDPSIMIVSILGLQSTGKSTLLNTIFGVNFSVNAGRCTRGAFMQLIPIHDALKKDCKCDYFLLVDTEGLKAPELDTTLTNDHDNQLATFVIGLANLTVVNIYGEILADMNDILQTAVHAFLRMKACDITLLNPGCHFVHQNVTDVMAGDKGIVGRGKARGILDEMTKLAAKEEGLENRYTCFNDIIKLKDTDVSYFPTLWLGDPPMAPVNPSYSMKSIMLTKHLVSLAKEAKQKSERRIVKFSYFKTYLEQLWKAILQENFIFSFKNTMEMAVYNMLDSQRSEWDWDFKKAMMTWEDDFEMEVCNGRSGSEESARHKLFSNADNKYVHLKKEIEQFFEKRTEKEILVIWRGETERQFERLYKTLTEHAKKHCEQVLKHKIAQKEIREIKRNYNNVLTEEVKELVANLGQQPLSEEELMQKFQEQWEKWIVKLDKMNFTVKQERDIKYDVHEVLKEHFGKKDFSALIKKLQSSPLDCQRYELCLCIEQKHVDSCMASQAVDPLVKQSRLGKLVSMFMPGTGKNSEPWRMLAEKETTHFFQEIEKYLEKKMKKDYQRSFATEMLEILKKNIDDFKSESFKFTLDYRLDMALTVCGYALRKFEDMSKLYRDAHDPVKCLEMERKHYFDDFKDYYEKKAQEHIAARQCCKIIGAAIEEKVIKSMCVKVVDEMKKDDKNDFLLTKASLIKEVLESIAIQLEHKKFDYCYKYLRHPLECLRDYVKERTESYCDYGHSQPRLVDYAKTLLSELMESIMKAVDEVSSYYRGSSKFSIPDWIERFKRSSISQKIVVNFSEIHELNEQKSRNDINYFTKELKLKLTETLESLHKTFSKLRASDMVSWERRPYDMIYEQVRGCESICPFCKEPCNKTNDHDGNHTVKLHRPKCVGGVRYRRTNIMVIETCTEAVINNRYFFISHDSEEKHPYRRCEEIHKKWYIERDLPSDASLFWKYVVAHFKTELAQLYNMEENSVPEDWGTFSLSKAIEDL